MPTRSAREIAELNPQIWKDHPDKAAGNTAVPLVAAHGDPANDAVEGPMLPTPYLAALPYTRRVFTALDSVIGRTRLMRIEEEHDLYEHVDMAYYWRDHLRVHVPVITDPSVEFWCGGESTHMGAGEVWVFDTWRRHKVINPANRSRIHLVIDTVGSATLWELIANPHQATREVTVDGPETVLITELVNRPSVISPWEMALAFNALVRDLEPGAHDEIASIERAFAPVLRAWRNAWARFGDSPDGTATYTQIRLEAVATLQRIAGNTKLPNRMSFVDAVTEHALVVPRAQPPKTVPAVASPAPSASSTASKPRPKPTIDRPVFIVSSPRSGSSLLFETLAQSPDLVTVGGESHQIIESIRGLRPSSHDWHSNRLDAADATPENADALRTRFVAELHDRAGQPPHGPVRMLEKTPKNSLRVPFLQTVFPDAVFVYLYRDPRETVSSMLDAWRSGRFVMYPDLPGWTGTPWSLLLVPGWRDLIDKPLGEVVTTQWASATSMLLDDLEALDPDRWCVASYDRLVADPQAEIERLAAFAEVRWDVELTNDLPLSRHTLDSPHPDKWMRNADELEPVLGSRRRRRRARACGVRHAAADRAGPPPSFARREPSRVQRTSVRARRSGDGRRGARGHVREPPHRLVPTGPRRAELLVVGIHVPERPDHRRCASTRESSTPISGRFPARWASRSEISTSRSGRSPTS